MRKLLTKWFNKGLGRGGGLQIGHHAGGTVGGNDASGGTGSADWQHGGMAAQSGGMAAKLWRHGGMAASPGGMAAEGGGLAARRNAQQ